MSGTPLKELGVLTILTPPGDITSARDSEIAFRFTISSSSPAASHGAPTSISPTSLSYNPQSTPLFLTYINQQNNPLSFPLQNVKVANGVVTSTAEFPGQSQEMNGLTIAAVTTEGGLFGSVDEVAGATVFGLGLIEVN